MLNRILTATAVGTVGALLSAGVAIANANSEGAGDGAIVNAQSVHGHKHAQHGEPTGHLPAEQSGVLELISRTRLKNVVPEKVADVDVLGTTAYLAAWGVTTCDDNGVHIVDVKNPAAPREIGFIKSKIGSYPGEGVQAVRITTPAFNGDILITNNEKCSEPQGFGGLNLYNVTNPSRPTPLVEGYGDATVNGQGKKDANEIHSVWAWDAGTKAYAVIVDNEEATDVDIIDITDPKKPALIAEYDLAEKFPRIVQTAPEGLDEVFLHDMVVKQIGGRFEMLLSYWDGGYVRLDMTNPLAPEYLGDTDYPVADQEGLESGLKDDTGRPVRPEGNGHQAEYTKDNKFILATDEDFGPYKGVSRNVTEGVAITAGTGSGTPNVPEGTTLSGTSVFVGRACPGATIPPAPAGTAEVPKQIAVVERGVCLFSEKVATLEAADAGYEGILIVNRTGSDGCSDGLGMTVDGGIPTFGVAPRQQGLALFGKEATYDEAACRADITLQQLDIAPGTTGDVLSFGSYFDGWGYVRAFETAAGADGKMTETGTYAVPQAHDKAFAEGFGDLSVHEVAMSEVDARRAYIAYYSAGVRAVDISTTGTITEVGAYVAPGGSNVWGIEVFTINGVEYVAGSDRDFGLLLFKARP